MNMSMDAQGDYHIKARDLRQLFAGFGRIPLSDSAIWSLSLAQSAMPPNHIGYEAWITLVADVDCHGEHMAAWAKSLAGSMANLKPLLGRQRRDPLVRSYRAEWGDQAALDGLSIALWGHNSVAGYDARAEAFKCRWQAYKRVRDLIAGVVTMQMHQYENALGWAVHLQRRG